MQPAWIHSSSSSPCMCTHAWTEDSCRCCCCSTYWSVHPFVHPWPSVQNKNSRAKVMQAQEKEIRDTQKNPEQSLIHLFFPAWIFPPPPELRLTEERKLFPCQLFSHVYFSLSGRLSLGRGWALSPSFRCFAWETVFFVPMIVNRKWIKD